MLYYYLEREEEEDDSSLNNCTCLEGSDVIEQECRILGRILCEGY